MIDTLKVFVYLVLKPVYAIEYINLFWRSSLGVKDACD